MNYEVYLRPLAPEDAASASIWRNNPVIWSFTKYKTYRHITPEIEREWINTVISRPDEIRFAICLKKTDQYIGNIQLTNIRHNTASYHIFIGVQKLWGKGIAQKATQFILKYAFLKLKLDMVLLDVHRKNEAALTVYKKTGFRQISFGHDFIDMALTRTEFMKH